MISSVKVHAFEFGSVPPELELKDVSDPLPDFYDDDDEADVDEEDDLDAGSPLEDAFVDGVAADHTRRGTDAGASHATASRRSSLQQKPALGIDTRGTGAANSTANPEHLRHPMSRASTPGIPGGTSNLSYFHLPLSAGLSGAATPFGAFGGPHGWLEQAHGPWHHHEIAPHDREQTSPRATAGAAPGTGHRLEAIPEVKRERTTDDVQIVVRVRYSGDVKLTLAADILLDYPMPSFVGIPLQLKVTGMTFDGIAILAYIKHKAHFCFLSPESADALVGDTGSGSDGEDTEPHKPIGKLFEEIRVESEIGKKGSGNLRNVSKVEKFILEQVRRMFETELVYPSFWTFLV